MAEEKRSQERVFPRDFQDFSVQLRLADLNIGGTLGNLSEEGMCAIVAGHGPTIAEVLETNRSIKGTIHGPRLQSDLQSEGRVIWTDERPLHGEPHRFLGVQFLKPLELPESVVALCLSEDR